MQNPSTCDYECECDKSCEIEEYLDVNKFSEFNWNLIQNLMNLECIFILI